MNGWNAADKRLLLREQRIDKSQTRSVKMAYKVAKAIFIIRFNSFLIPSQPVY